MVSSEEIFETRKVLESELNDDWYRDNVIFDDQHDLMMQKQEEERKKALAGILPDSPLYSLKTLKDKIVLGTAADTYRKMLTRLEIASRKLIEATILMEQKKEDQAYAAVTDFINEVKTIALEVDQEDLSEEEIAKVRRKIQETLDFHQRLFSDVLPDSELYEFKQLMHDLEITIAFDVKNKTKLEQEYKKQAALDMLDLTKKTENIDLLNASMMEYKIRFADDMHASAGISDLLI